MQRAGAARLPIKLVAELGPERVEGRPHCQGTQGLTVQQLDTGEQSVDTNRRWDAGVQGAFLRVNGR